MTKEMKMSIKEHEMILQFVWMNVGNYRKSLLHKCYQCRCMILHLRHIKSRCWSMRKVPLESRLWLSYSEWNLLLVSDYYLLDSIYLIMDSFITNGGSFGSVPQIYIQILMYDTLVHPITITNTLTPTNLLLLLLSHPIIMTPIIITLLAQPRRNDNSANNRFLYLPKTWGYLPNVIYPKMRRGSESKQITD